MKQNGYFMAITIKSKSNSKVIKEKLASVSKSSKFDSKKYLGKLSIKKDALSIQKEIRSEW